METLVVDASRTDTTSDIGRARLRRWRRRGFAVVVVHHVARQCPTCDGAV